MNKGAYNIPLRHLLLETTQRHVKYFVTMVKVVIDFIGCMEHLLLIDVGGGWLGANIRFLGTFLLTNKWNCAEALPPEITNS